MTAIEEDRPAAVAADINGSFSPSVKAEDANKKFMDFLSIVVKDCVSAGAVMIGHVKANVRSNGEMLSMSSTTDNGAVRTRSVFSLPVEKYEMTVNVIVYGLDEVAISKILNNRIGMLGKPSIEIVSETGCQDPECDDPDCKSAAHRVITIS